MLYKNLQAKFAKFFAAGQLEEVEAKDIPPETLDLFTSFSKRGVPEAQHQLITFKTFFVLRHDNQDLTFIAQAVKTSGSKFDAKKYSCYFLDYRNQEQIGYGVVYDHGQAIVGMNKTEEDYQEQGLGTRRLLMMNAMSRVINNSPLHSSTIITTEAKSLWRHLVEIGLARPQPRRRRFVML